jgi:acetyl esterase/lipase
MSTCQKFRARFDQRVLVTLLAIASALAFRTATGCAAQDPAVSDKIVYQQDVPYTTVMHDGKQIELKFDQARPKEGDGPFPGIVCILGGGWRGGDKIAYRKAIQLFADQGYVAIAVQYRFTPKHAFPAQLDDVKNAVRYLRTHAQELKLDPQRIGATGGSAGGHLSLMLGATDSNDNLEPVGDKNVSTRLQAVASVAGPTDLTLVDTFPEIVVGMLNDLAGVEADQRAAALKRASPITYLTADDPPMLLVHGTKDNLVPYDQATAWITACQKVKVPAELITIENGGHGGGGDPAAWQDANKRILAFFDEHLKP